MAITKSRIIKTGNSLGLSLPADVLSALNVKEGNKVRVELVGNHVIIKKASNMSQLSENLPADFLDRLEEEIEAHHETLKGLVDR